jgi:hypothetical protein
MAFLWGTHHWATVAEFASYLKSLPVAPVWQFEDKNYRPDGVTIHHTFIPEVDQWRGQSSMNGIRDYYANEQKWDRGPHLFIAPDGLWEGTPLTYWGIHAGSCNLHKFGFEIVGNYDKKIWIEPIHSLVYDTLVTVYRHFRFDPATLRGHRECGSDKTCPGSAINMDAVRAALQVKLAVPAPTDIIVIGVDPVTTLSSFKRSLERHSAIISSNEVERIYQMCQWLQVDPAFIMSWWVQRGMSLQGWESLQLYFMHMVLTVKNEGHDGHLTVRSLADVFQIPELAEPIIIDMEYIRNH